MLHVHLQVLSPGDADSWGRNLYANLSMGGRETRCLNARLCSQLCQVSNIFKLGNIFHSFLNINTSWCCRFTKMVLEEHLSAQILQNNFA